MPSEVRRTSLRQSSSLAWLFITYATMVRCPMTFRFRLSLTSSSDGFACLSRLSENLFTALNTLGVVLIGQLSFWLTSARYKRFLVVLLFLRSSPSCYLHHSTTSAVDSINMLVFPNRQWRLNKPWLVHRTMLNTTRCIYSKSPVYDEVYKKNTNRSKW